LKKPLTYTVNVITNSIGGIIMDETIKSAAEELKEKLVFDQKNGGLLLSQEELKEHTIFLRATSVFRQCKNRA
jgi:hypothetical protein